MQKRGSGTPQGGPLSIRSFGRGNERTPMHPRMKCSRFCGFLRFFRGFGGFWSILVDFGRFLAFFRVFFTFFHFFFIFFHFFYKFLFILLHSCFITLISFIIVNKFIFYLQWLNKIMQKTCKKHEKRASRQKGKHYFSLFLAIFRPLFTRSFNLGP